MRNPRSGTVGKYLLLLVFLGLLIGYFVWVKWQGVAGNVTPFPESTASRIAFVRQDGGKQNLFIVKDDGSDLRQLTDGFAGVRAPSWSPDGKQIAFAAEPQKPGPEGRAFQLYIKGAADDPRQITTGSLSKDLPQWRFDGKMLAFLTGGVIKVVQPNGDEMRQIYPPPHRSTSTDQGSGQSPDDDAGSMKLPPIEFYRWAPKALPIVARQVTDSAMPTVGQGQWWDKDQRPATAQDGPGVLEAESLVLLPNLDVDKPVFLPNSSANQVGVSWYPDNNRIAATLSGQAGNHNAAVYRADDPTNPAVGLFLAARYTIALQSPAVSPDGKQIAYEVWKMESAENRSLLGIAIGAGEGPTLEVNTAADISKIALKLRGDFHNPQWSPDGAKLLYWTNGKSGRDYWVVNADGSNPVNITKGVGDNFDAAWSPATK